MCIRDRCVLSLRILFRCVSVDAFIIRRAVFSSITKPYKPFLLPAPVFRSCCIFMRYLQNIFIFYAFTQYIFGAHAACPEACADYSTRKEFTPQKQKARDPFVSRLALKESRVSFWLYAPENGPPAAVHAAHSSSFWALGSCLRAYSRRRAARLSAHSSR